MNTNTFKSIHQHIQVATERVAERRVNDKINANI